MDCHNTRYVFVFPSASLSFAARCSRCFRFQAGLRTLHGLGPQLRRAISGQLGEDDDDLFLKEDASQKAQVILDNEIFRL